MFPSDLAVDSFGKMRLAGADSPMEKQRAVPPSGFQCDLLCGGQGEFVARSGDELPKVAKTAKLVRIAGSIRRG